VDNSRPAVNFRLAAFPNNWGRQTKGGGGAPENLSDRRVAYQTFFQSLIDELRERHQFTNARIGQPQNWYYFPTGIAGIGYGVTFSSNGLRAELYVDTGDAATNTAIFDGLASEREIIERDLGFTLCWGPLEGRRACRVATYRDGSSVIETDHEALLKWTVERLLRLRDVFGPRLRPAVANAARSAGVRAEPATSKATIAA
jgi:hypothetical protein